MINTLELTFESTRSDRVPFSVINKRSENVIKIGGVELLLYIEKLQYKKEVYSPCRVDANIILMSKQEGKFPSIDELRNLFLYTNVTLKLTKVETESVTESNGYQGSASEDNGDKVEIGTGYQVFSVVPRITRSGGTRLCYVSLVIYSKDYLLTLEKYCRSYTGQKLGGHILTDVMKATTGLGNNALLFSPDNLVLGKYKPSGDNAVWTEFRHPYLVQYNESFYDFFARTCNRCGEFFFFEGGKVTLGLPPNTHTSEESDGTKPYFVVNPGYILSIAYPVLSDSDKYLTANYYNYLTDDAPTHNSKGYDWDAPTDEYFDEIDTNGPDSVLKELNIGSKVKTILANMPIKMQTASTVSEVIGRMITDLALDATNDTLSAKYCNDDFKNAVDTKASSNMSNYSAEEQKQNGKINQFASLPADNVTHVMSDKYKNLSSSFFQYVRSKQEEASKSAIELELAVVPELVALKVGERIKVDSDTYVVLSINGAFSQSNGQVNETLQILAIPYTDSVIVPPLYKLAEAQKVSAQPAFVADNFDPEYMGRVRVRFPWQGADESPSPWIRMATPMASSSGGFFARPEKDDEVLVDFRNGNILHPVVIGALYRKDRPTPHKYKYSYSGLYSSRWQNNCGQALVLQNGNPKDFALSFFPALGAISGMFPATLTNDLFSEIATDTTEKELQKLSGGITLTDTYGIVSITTNTPKRSISIDSPFGSVSINALTGITLSSIHGDITIEGKNVNIRALNNVQIESGINIRNQRRKYAFEKKMNKLNVCGLSTLLSGAASKIIEKLTPPVDLTLVRCLWSALFATPIEGTMLIKSHRYLHLEAGAGKSSDTSMGFISSLESDPVMELNATLKILERRIKSELRVAFSVYGRARSVIVNFENLLGLNDLRGLEYGYANVAAAVKDMYPKTKYSKKVKYQGTDYDCKDLLIDVRNFPDNYNNSRLLRKKLKHYDTYLLSLSSIVIHSPNPKNKELYKLSEGTGYVPKSLRSGAEDALKDALTHYLDAKELYPAGDNFKYEKDFSASEERTTVTYAVRWAQYKLLKSLDFIGYDANIITTDTDVENSEKWNNFVASLTVNPQAPSKMALLQAGQALTNMGKSFIFWDKLHEQTRWMPEQKGRILMSDSPQSTMMLTNEGVWERKENGLAALKSILKASPVLEDIDEQEPDEEDGAEGENA